MSKLAFKKMGSGYPLIILHGLYGSGSNWFSIAKELSSICEVYLVDQRNHGSSPHYDDHSYALMAEDLLAFMNDQGLEKPIVLGHSMGGKVAMWFATEHPHRISRLIVADISPLSYIRKGQAAEHIVGHEKIMNALLSIDLSRVGSLKEAENELENEFPDRKLRQFLLMNLVKNDSGMYVWRLNIPVLLNHLEDLADGLDWNKIGDKSFRSFPVLVVKGALSPYIQEDDERAIKRLFPSSNLVSINGAGHWLHAEEPAIFTKTIKKFLLEY